MKSTISKVITLSFLMFSVSAIANSTPSSKKVTLGLSEVYIPGGFSSTTDAFVIVSGMYPNSCYKWSNAEINHSSSSLHEVRAIADVAQGTMCLMVLIPYQKEVNLGRMQAGEHTLRFVNGDGTYFERTMTVE
jgi:hypothetical protein